MELHSRIETQEAQQLRNERQHFAAPGGSHDRLVKFLGKALPMGVGVVAALMVITPLSPGSEVSFLLDRNKVAMIDERLSVSNAMYRGQDDGGRPFSLTAGEAVQRSSREGIVRWGENGEGSFTAEGASQISCNDCGFEGLVVRAVDDDVHHSSQRRRRRCWQQNRVDDMDHAIVGHEVGHCDEGVVHVRS